MTRPSGQARRCVLQATLALGASALVGCTPSSWIDEKKLAPVVFPRAILPIMVFRSDYILRADREGFTDAVASSLSSELGTYGIQTTVVELAGEPRSPRLELAIWNLEAPHQTESAAITLDCAYVSPDEKVAYVGRVRVKGLSISAAVEPIARAVAEKLVSESS